MGYQLIRRLAVGGMAEVFLARQLGARGFAKPVALKRILPHLAGEPSYRTMFLEEARLAAAVTHPNVVQVYDFGEERGGHYLAMEYVEGWDLASILTAAPGPMPGRLAAWIVAGVAAGLAAVHDAGIVHRDVTPSNILVGTHGAVKLADFGVATWGGAPGCGGKHAYMSPEQARGEALDGRSDLFALGVVAHELATAERLFARPTDLATMDAVQRAPIPPINETVDKLLARDRDERFPSAMAVVEALQDEMQGDAPRELAAWCARLPAGEPGEADATVTRPTAPRSLRTG